MRVLSLFDGISAGQVALGRAGIKVDNYFASEIDKYAISITQKNYPNTIQLGDIYNINYSKLPKIDMVIGGSPCTFWSISKKNRETTSEGVGFDLFMQFVKAIEICKPKYFLYENNNSIHKDIKAAISEKLGVEPIMINSALLSAQQRKRCYWTNISNITQPKDKGILLKDILVSGVPYQNKAHTLTASYNGAVIWNSLERHQRSMVAETVRLGQIGKGGQGDRIYSVTGKSVCLSANGGGRGAKTGLYKIDLPDGDYLIRKLLPVECERLQTFGDGYTEGVSNTQRYKALGNSWTVDVITHILSFMKLKEIYTYQLRESEVEEGYFIVEDEYLLNKILINIDMIISIHKFYGSKFQKVCYSSINNDKHIITMVNGFEYLIDNASYKKLMGWQDVRRNRRQA